MVTKYYLTFLIIIAVPPRIEDGLSSGDKVRTEGTNVTLECAARGSPMPTVLWKREDGQNINIDKAKNISGMKNIYTAQVLKTTDKNRA